MFPARRKEFQSPLGEEALRSIRVGVLATPESAEVRPLNFVYHDGAIWLHSAPEGCLMQRAGHSAVFTGWYDEAWIPSSWRHPRQACPATTYYTSVVARGRLEEVGDRAVKAEVLQIFMEKYQPEGGYVPLDPNDQLYAGPLDALGVLRMSIEDLSCKAKYGQNLSPKHRQRVLEGLLGRADWHTADLLRRHNPTMPFPEGISCDVSAMPAQAIWDLLRPTYWADRRSLETVASNRLSAQAQWGYFEDGRLLGYLRVAKDWLYDVVVTEERRGQGIGDRLLSACLADPKVASLPRLGLDTSARPEGDPRRLYARHGFMEIGTRPDGGVVMMRYS